MSHASCFAAAFQSHGTLDNARPLSSEPSKKRKRDSTRSTSDIASRVDEPPSTISLAEHTHSLTDSGRETLLGGVRGQYEISGQPTTVGLSEDKFPHGSLHTLEHLSLSGSKSAVADELANIRPPLYVDARSNFTSTNDQLRSVGLRQQHLAAVTAVMHKCLLEGDYSRATRAWGMLLRAEHNGHSLDLRTNDRWGLGAECLLRRQPQFTAEVEQLIRTPKMGEQHRASKTEHNMQNIQEVKNYYERLILQYPYRKASPNTTDPQDFYLAMFGLWIFSVQERRRSSIVRDEKSFGRQTGTTVSGLGEGSNAPSFESDSHRHQQDEVTRQDTLERAREIVARLEGLLNSPPYSDNARYWELLGMVNLWIGDLSNVTGAQVSGMNTGEDNPSIISDDSGLSTNANNEEVSQDRRSDRYIQRAKAIADAENAFENARHCSKGVI